MYFHLTVNITFYLLLLGAITAFPAPMEEGGKAALDSDSKTKNEESLSVTTTEPVINKEETSQASSVEPKDASSEEHQRVNHNESSKKTEPESKNNDKSTKGVTEHTSKKHSTVKPKSKPAVVEKEKKAKRVGAAEKSHRGKVTKTPHQKGRLAVSKHKHESISNDDSSSYEEHKKQKSRKSTSGSSHQKPLVTSTSPETMIMLERVSKQQLEILELLKQMGMRQASMEGSIYHIARNFPVGNPDYK